MPLAWTLVLFVASCKIAQKDEILRPIDRLIGIITF
jgi:hypothetical protein